MITSADNEQLKTIRKLRERSWRDKLGLFVAEGEDLVDAAAAAGWEPEFVLRAGADVEPELLDEVSTLGSGHARDRRLRAALVGARRRPSASTCTAWATRATWARSIRTAHALCDGPVVLGPGCADPWSPKAVRASMGSIFARPPARGEPAGQPAWRSTRARSATLGRGGGRGAG